MANKNALFINGTNILFNDTTNVVVNYRATPNINAESDTAEILVTQNYTNFISEIKQNDTVQIWRGKTAYTEKRIFKGRVQVVRPQGPLIVIEATGDFSTLEKKEVNQTYDKNLDVEAGNLGEILEDVITDGGLTANIVTTSLIVDKLEFRNEKRSRAALDIANTLIYQLYYDHHNAIVIGEPKQYSSSGITFSSGVFPVLNIPEFRDDSQKVINEFVVEGAEKLVGKTQWFNGTGVEDTFTLLRTARSINAVWSGTNDFTTTRPTDTDLQTGGQEGVTADIDYTWFENTKDVIFLSGSIPSSGTNNIQIDYTYPESLPVSVRSNESINYYGEVFKQTVVVEGIKTVDDAESVGNSLIEEFAFQKTEADFEIINDLTIDETMSSVDIGKAVTVIDTISPESRNAEYVIRKIVYQYPEPFDIVTVGDRLYELNDIIDTMEQRIKRLEEKTKNSDFANDISQVENIVSVRGIAEVWEAPLDSGVLYWDDDNQGLWANDAGTVGYNWGNDTAETNTLVRRVHGVGNIYYEDFYDNDLTDTGNTTCTVDTTNHKLTFTTGEVWISDVIFLDNKSFNNIRWSLLNVATTGLSNLTFYASADGKSNWETITLGSTITFMNKSTAGVYLKIEASDTAELEFVDAYDMSSPWKVEVNVGS